MYAVIKTGGKQYRVQPGDLLVVEKIEADIGATVSFDQVLMLGGVDGAITVGAPLIDGAVVSATLIETRKGDKVHTVKKIRRQGHRRTKGHRQLESVLRVTGLDGAGQSLTWDGEVDLTPRSVLRHRARNLAVRDIPTDHALVVAEDAPVETLAEAPAVEAPVVAKPAPKRAAKPKADVAPETATDAAEDKPAVEPARADTAAASDDEA